MMHAMSEKWEHCEYCNSTNIERMLANIAYDVKPSNYRKKVGDVVKTHIDEAREDIKEFKKNMKKEF